MNSRNDHFTGYFLEPKCVAESKVLILLICHKDFKLFKSSEPIYAYHLSLAFQGFARGLSIEIRLTGSLIFIIHAYKNVWLMLFEKTLKIDVETSDFT